MVNLIAYVAGGVAGMLITVRLFLLLAGVRFTHWRQVIAAYLAAAIAATFIVAMGAADGGAPNFDTAPNQWLGAILAVTLEIILLRGRRAREGEAG